MGNPYHLGVSKFSSHYMGDTNMNLSDDELEELEAQYEQLDPKVLQIQMLMELKAIRMHLADGESETTEKPTEVYQCSACMETVPSDELQSHAVEHHNAPADMPVEDLGLYSIE